jgi:hypothetical protein
MHTTLLLDSWPLTDQHPGYPSSSLTTSGGAGAEIENRYSFDILIVRGRRTFTFLIMQANLTTFSSSLWDQYKKRKNL